MVKDFKKYPLPEKWDKKTIDILKRLSVYNSTRAVKTAGIFKKHRKKIQTLISTHFFLNKHNLHSAKNSELRVASWNIERGTHLEGIIHTFKNNPELKNADVLLLTELDIGMSRSSNKNIPLELAKALNMNVFFANSYLCFSRGTPQEEVASQANTLGLHGNAILSKYPLSKAQTIALFNCKDKFCDGEKRLGNQNALIAQTKINNKTFLFCCNHLDAHSSPKQRKKQTEQILKTLKKQKLMSDRIVIGGDWNTHTYNSKSGLIACLSAFRHLAIWGSEKLVNYHYLYPYKKAEPLFKSLRKYKFNFKDFNELGKGTLPYKTNDKKLNEKMNEHIPKFIISFFNKLLKKLGGGSSCKVDWIAALNCVAVPNSAKVLPIPKFNQAALSDHNPIVVNIKL